MRGRKLIPNVATQQSSINQAKFPAYFKSTHDMKEIDVYAVHAMFQIQDASGALQHASKKILLAGHRNGGKTQREDIREARDALNRWLELVTQMEA